MLNWEKATLIKERGGGLRDHEARDGVTGMARCFNVWKLEQPSGFCKSAQGNGSEIALMPDVDREIHY